MSSFRVLNLRYLRRQPLRAFLAVLAIAAAVAITVAILVLVATLDRSLERMLESVAGPAPLRVIGPLTRGGVAPNTVDAVEATDGVARAVPVVQAFVPAHTTDREPVYMLALGLDCRVEALVGSFGCDEQTLNVRRDGPALVSARLIKEVGRDADIRTDHGRVPVQGAVVNDSLDDINSGRVAIFDLEAAQRFFDRGDNFDAIYVEPEPGTDVDRLAGALRRTVGPTNLVLRADEPAPGMLTRGPLIPLLGLALVIALGLSGLLVYNILSLSLAERRRDIAIASSIGTPPSKLALGMVAEAAMLGLAGAVIGIGTGLVLARPIVANFASVISEQASGIKVDVHSPLSAYVTGLIVGAGVGALSSLVPVRRALRLDLAAELHGRAPITEGTPRRTLRRLVLLLLAGAATIVLSGVARSNGGLEPWQPPLAALCLVTSAVVLFATIGAVAPLLIAAALHSLKNTGGSLRIAMSNLVNLPRRTSVIATAVGAAVGMACVLGALIPSIKSTVGKSELVGSEGRVSVATLPFNNASNVDARPSVSLVRKLEAFPGVASVDLAYVHEISDQHGTYGLRSFGGQRTPFERVMGQIGPEVLERGDAIVGTSLARVRGLRPGSTLRVATPTGFVPITVAGIWVNSYDNGHNVTVSQKVFDDLFGTPAPHSVNLDADRGVSSEELVRRLKAAQLDPDATVLTGRQAASDLADEIAEQASPFWALQRLLLFVALVGTLSTLLLVGIQRRRELGILGAVGFAPTALGRMTLAEGLAAGFAGSLLGVIASTGVFEVLRNASAVSIGVRPTYSFAPLSGVAAIALAAVVVALGAALPAWRAARVQIVEAIRDE